MKLGEGNVPFVSALASASLSLLAALAFFLATTLAGGYGWVARLGGSGWIFLLAMIILLPTVMPWLRQRVRAAGEISPAEHEVTTGPHH